MQVDIDAAGMQLASLVEAALVGENVVITRGTTPVVRLVPVRVGQFGLGLLGERLLSDGPDFFERPGGDELVAWEGH